MKSIAHFASITALFSAFILCSASATERYFTYTYEPETMPQGLCEYEQWVTYRTHTANDHSFTSIDFRHEFEMGITDNFDLRVYLPSWRYEDTDEHAGTRFGSIDVEGVAYLSNPVTDRVGLALYNEVRVGEDELAFEHKLLVQKDIGKWILLYNLVLETEIEGVFNGGEENEVKGVLGHTMGVGYAVAPGWFLGAEGVVESVFEDWSDYKHTTVYAGPVLSYQADRWWATVTPVYQLSDVEDESDFQLRLIFGLTF